MLYEVITDYLLKSYDVDLPTISSRIENFNQNVSGGSIVEMGRRYIVRGLSELEQVHDLENIILKIGSPDPETRITSYNVCYTKLLREFTSSGVAYTTLVCSSSNFFNARLRG